MENELTFNKGYYRILNRKFSEFLESIKKSTNLFGGCLVLWLTKLSSDINLRIQLLA